MVSIQFRQIEQLAALQFVQEFMDISIEKIALENPIGVISTAIRRPDQIIQFGHGETKATCLWLKNLPICCLQTSYLGEEQESINGIISR